MDGQLPKGSNRSLCCILHPSMARCLRPTCLRDVQVAALAARYSIPAVTFDGLLWVRSAPICGGFGRPRVSKEGRARRQWGAVGMQKLGHVPGFMLACLVSCWRGAPPSWVSIKLCLHPLSFGPSPPCFRSGGAMHRRRLPWARERVLHGHFVGMGTPPAAQLVWTGHRPQVAACSRRRVTTQLLNRG